MTRLFIAAALFMVAGVGFVIAGHGPVGALLLVTGGVSVAVLTITRR